MLTVANLNQWIEGARPRTLPAALSPVIAGSAVAVWADSFGWAGALGALVVALALQIGVNYANDYSDGIRGTDDDRVGPLRLTGSGLATPRSVKLAAFGWFGVAAVAGLALAIATDWWLVLVGVVCILAAWFYTGGEHPYGYAGLGEVMVFVFFGLVATVGTTWVQISDLDSPGRALAVSVAAAFGVGSLACAILVANNLRDIPTDTVSGKNTLAVRLGDPGTRVLYAGLTAVATVAVVVVAGLAESWWPLVGLAFLAVSAPAVAAVRSGATGPGLIPVLAATGRAELVWSALVALGLLLTQLT
ncbi:1,4-dihydroxy-2-naphthoate polyprenyltransferase [soil metagenome]